jgi:hypothetical protein
MFFLAYRLVSETFSFILMFSFATLFLVQVLREQKFLKMLSKITNDGKARIFLGIAIAWIIIAAISLIDLQIGNRLYFNITAFDYQTRVSVINAITRTGVPPINPSYYPGGPVKLTFLYYFWYILCSLVDKLGGNNVDARMALAASVIWAGLALIVTIALYLRIRDSGSGNIWRSSLIGISLLAVSGLDVFPSTLYMAFPQLLYGYFIDGDIEHWNEQITAWVGTTMWTPHHLVSLLNCVLGIMLIAYHKNARPLQRFASAFVSGIAFASAFGLSSWVTLIFVIFWAAWFGIRLLNGEGLKSIWIMILPGIVAAIAILPFVLDLFGGGNSESTSGFPLEITARWFRPVLLFTIGLSGWQVNLVNLMLLPLNYFLELGFFFLAGIVWLKLRRKGSMPDNFLIRAEITLLAITILLTSFTRSTIIANNDFGWRGWLPGQFILLIWGTDVLSYLWKKKPINLKILLIRPGPMNKVKFTLLLTIALGVLTSVQDIVYLRTWPILVDSGTYVLPEQIRSDQYLGTKNFEARTAYSLIDKNYPEDVVVQFNPLVGLDRPSGLYRTRPVVISYHSLYGVSPDLYKPLALKVSQLFTAQQSNWNAINDACKYNEINIIIYADTDKLWDQIHILTNNRKPLYSGKHYIIFNCGV